MTFFGTLAVSVIAMEDEIFELPNWNSIVIHNPIHIMLLFYITDAKTWEEATLNLDKLYSERPPIEDFLAWRDLRVIDECHWYG